MPIIPVDPQPISTAADLRMYCSITQAKDAGARGTDAEVTAAINEATARVERYTADLFVPVELTLQRPLDPDGYVRLGKRIISIQSVRYATLTTLLDPSAYRFSDVSGDRLSFIGSLAWSDVTVNGAEPYSGGWANLTGPDPEVVVVGTFGRDTPPLDVQRATAIIAAHIRGADETPDPAGTDASSHVDLEGNVLPVVPPFTDVAADRARAQSSVVRARTTGVDEADALLAPYVREPVRLRA